MNYQNMQQLNEMFLKKIEPILEQMNSVSQKYEVCVEDNVLTVKESVIKERYTKVIYFISEIDCTIRKHLIVKVGFINDNQEFQVENFEKVYRMIKDYWEEVTQLKDMQGFVFVYNVRRIIGKMLQTFLTHFGTGNKNDKCDSLVLSTPTLQHSYQVIYASYSESFIRSVDNFRKTILELYSMIEEKPLLKPSKKQLIKLFNNELWIRYAGTRVYLKLMNEFKNIKMWEQEKVECTILPAKKENIISFLNTIKENQRLKTVIEVPRLNFNRVLFKIISHSSNHSVSDVKHPLYHVTERVYQELSKIGDWEAVEDEMGYIYYEVMNPSSCPPKRVIKFEEKDLELIIQRVKTPNYYFYFISEKNTVQDEVVNFNIFFSNEKNNMELISYLSEIDMI